MPRCEGCKFWTRDRMIAIYESWGECERLIHKPPPLGFAIIGGHYEVFVTAPDFFCAEFAPKSVGSEAVE